MSVALGCPPSTFVHQRRRTGDPLTSPPPCQFILPSCAHNDNICKLPSCSVCAGNCGGCTIPHSFPPLPRPSLLLGGVPAPCLLAPLEGRRTLRRRSCTAGCPSHAGVAAAGAAWRGAACGCTLAAAGVLEQWPTARGGSRGQHFVEGHMTEVL